ncbi:secretory phospholipase A2 receptor-like [Branchiostoma floridae x Branchiostoma japonicum]
MGTPAGVKLVWFILIFNIAQDKAHVSAAYVCDPGWQQFGTSCFQIHNSPLSTYPDAEAVCSADGSLAMPKDRDTNDFLVSMIRDTDQSLRTWVGLRFNGAEWTWSDGTVFQPGVYSNWAGEEPNGDGNCVHYIASSRTEDRKEKWNDAPCDVTVMFICQKEVCDPEWQQFGSSCFHIHNSPLSTYPDAEAVCSADGSLAMPKDQATNDFLVSMIRATDQSLDTWIGLRADGIGFKWSDGTAFQAGVYSNWADGGEPSRDGDCVHYFPSSLPDGYKEKWNDASCDVTFMFICQKEGTESLWQQIDGGLKSVSVGRAGVWGVSGTGEVLYRIGTYENETSPGLYP